MKKYIYFVLLLIMIMIICIYLLNNFNNIKIETFNNNISNKVTICFKTLYRSNLVYEHLKQLRKKLPSIQIIIADDSDKKYMKKNIEAINKSSPNDENILHLKLPFDSGLSRGRNECIKHVKTPYVIMTDDSRMIKNINELKKMVHFLENNKKYDIITGNSNGRQGIHSNYIGIFEYVEDENNTKIDKQNYNIDKKMKLYYKKIDTNKNQKLFKTNIGINCFLARTDLLKKYKWNNKLKIGEHEDFFIRLWFDKIQILYNNKLNFKQFNDKLRVYDKDGLNLRKRAETIYKIIDFIEIQ